MKPLVFHPEARLELKVAGQYYAERSLETAQRFYDEIDLVLAEIEARPNLRRMYDPPARRHFGAVFPYAVIYLDQPERLWVVAVMHFKQRPGYWRDRVA
ncbi:type II toxin-antitoxin system RelE/ParE family toxin [Nibricoccus sp. IMCC34717]|uniref:type II toxin-antitoxin system RelE/ParE family toxin n=1 Tax=Nibricoccus sp. IMCC34717 TaxID=3034021 RepID=UPI00384AF032